MAKQTQNTSAPELGAVSTETAVSTVHPMETKLALLDMLAEKNQSEMIELTGGEFIKFEEGKTYHFVAVGFEKTNGEYGEKENAVLIDRAGNKFFNGDAVLLSTLKKFTPETLAEGLPIRIFHAGMKKGDNGNYRDLKIFRV